MKHLLAIFLIGVSCFLFGCGNENEARKHNNLGNAYYRQGEHDLAIASYQKAIAIKPDYAKAYSNLGAAYDEQGKFDEAVESHQKAISINPN